LLVLVLVVAQTAMLVVVAELVDIESLRVRH
jgi:hypothetical protein